MIGRKRGCALRLFHRWDLVSEGSARTPDLAGVASIQSHGLAPTVIPRLPLNPLDALRFRQLGGIAEALGAAFVGFYVKLR